MTLSGDARMGIVNDGTDTHFSSRARVAFALSGETDGGLSFSAGFRADNAIGASAGSAGSVALAGAFGKLSMGNVAGAAEAAVGDLSGVGYEGLGDYSDTLFLTGDGVEGEPIVQYAYTAGDLSVYASASDGVEASNYAVGVAYTMGDYTAGVGYESTDSFDANLTADGVPVDTDNQDIGDASHIAASFGATFGAVAAKVVYGQADVQGLDVTQMGASATYTMDAVAVTGFYKSIDTAELVGGADTAVLGLGVAYDLGGGAAVRAGVVNVDTGAAESETSYDAGVTFAF